jgi:hypothetical protein
MFEFNSWCPLHVSKIVCLSSGRPFVRAVLCGMFLYIYVCSLAGGRMCWLAYINAWKTYHRKLHVQMVFLLTNTWCSKHVDDTKNWRLYGCASWHISTAKPTRCTSFSNLFYLVVALYMFRTVFPSVVRSLRLYIQHQVYVNQILLTAC